MEYLTNINWDVMSDYMSTGINRDMMLIGGVVGLFALFWFFMIFYAIYLTISSSIKGKDSFDESQELMESAQGKINDFKQKKYCDLGISGVTICPKCGAAFEPDKAECKYCHYVSPEREEIRKINIDNENSDKRELYKLSIQYKKAKFTYNIKSNIFKYPLYMMGAVFIGVPSFMIVKMLYLFLLMFFT